MMMQECRCRKKQRKAKKTKHNSSEGLQLTCRSELHLTKRRDAQLAVGYTGFLCILYFTSYIEILVGSKTDWTAIYLNNYSDAEQLKMTNFKDHQLFCCDSYPPPFVQKPLLSGKELTPWDWVGLTPSHPSSKPQSRTTRDPGPAKTPISLNIVIGSKKNM